MEHQIKSAVRDVAQRYFCRWLAGILCLYFSVQAARADAIDWPTLGFTQVGTASFTQPTVITHAGDGSGRLFVVEQPGRIQIVAGTNKLATPFMDISPKVILDPEGGEQGLLGLAFPPGFSTNQHFYVNYTRVPDGALVISRFNISATNANVADTNSEQVVLVIPKPYTIHNAGQLAFGPDGYLYIAVGDGGPEGDPLNNGQSTVTLLGKILRIDVESSATPYAVPANNPFVGNTNYAPEIWAFGLRNPWRFSFDRLTGDLYIGDVGQNSYEEIDFQPAGSAGGQNYGWHIMEGPTNYDVPPGFTNFAAFTAPVAWYSHQIQPNDNEAAVIGGYVYRGPDSPRLNGMYFFGDFISGWVWGMKQSGSNWVSRPVNQGGMSLISTFGEDDSGQLYVANYSGTIYQIVDSGQAITPTFQVTNDILNVPFAVVNCLTTNATIHYTTNGVDPTDLDPSVLAGDSIPVTPGMNYKIRAYRANLTPSGVTNETFSFQAGLPIFTPPDGSFITNKTRVSISTVTPGATIYYTTNGTTPTTSSKVYTNSIALSGGSLLEAICVANGYATGNVGMAHYSTTLVAMPVFSPATDVITNNTWITITTTTPHAVIHFTTSGKNPTTGSPVYARPIKMSGGKTLKAFAVEKNYSNSLVASVTYTTMPTATPVISPAGGTFTNETLVTMTCATPGSRIYYTTNNAFPTTRSPLYTRPLSINRTTVISAFAVTKNYANSGLATVVFQFGQVVAPGFVPAPESLPGKTTIAIVNDTSAGARLVTQSAGHARIQWQSITGKVYLMQYSDDLVTWTTLGNPMTGDGSVMSATDPTPVQQAPHRYYRVYPGQ